MPKMRRTLYAVVPVKILSRAKTRLAPSLTFAQRLRLAREFLHHTLDIVGRCAGPTRTIVVSADAYVLRLTRTRRMIAIPQMARGGLNRAIAMGCRYALSHGGAAVLIVPIDLPLLTVRSLSHLARPSARPVVRIAPDRHCAGTNALYMQPVRAGFASFGKDSFQRHQALCSELGISNEIVRQSALALDIDVAEDLAALANRRPGLRIKKVVRLGACHSGN